MKKCLSLIHWATFHGNVISIDKYVSHFHWDTFHDEVFILYPFINDHKVRKRTSTNVNRI